MVWMASDTPPALDLWFVYLFNVQRDPVFPCLPNTYFAVVLIRQFLISNNNNILETKSLHVDFLYMKNGLDIVK